MAAPYERDGRVTREAQAGKTPAFDDEAGRVLAHARAAARRLRHTHLGTEHLLLGMLDAPRSLALAIIHQANVQPEDVRRAVALLAPPGQASPEAEFVMAPPLRHLLRLAPEEAQRLGDDAVRSEHLLLAALREGRGGAAVVLKAMGLNLEAVRLAVARERPGGAEARAASGWVPRGPYQFFAWLGTAALVAALTVAFVWVFASLARHGQLSPYLLVVPLALLGIAFALLGSSRMEAQRGAASIEATVTQWRARRAPAQVAQALRLAEAGQLPAAERMLAAAVSRPMPESEYRSALPALAPWLTHEQWAALGLRARAELHFHAGRDEPALADLTQALQRAPDHPGWHVLLGAILTHAGRPADALDAFRTACRLHPDDSAGWIALADAALLQADLAEADAAARRAISLAPDSPQPQLAVAVLAFLRDQMDDADPALARALQLDLDAFPAQVLRAALLLRRGQPEDALAAAHEAASGVSEPHPILAAVEGWALAALDRRQEARAAFTDARARGPELLPLAQRLAAALEAEGRATAATQARAWAALLSG